MSDLTLLMMSKVELIEIIKSKDEAWHARTIEGHEKDKLIQNLRIFIEELQRKKLELLDRIIEQRKSLNLRQDIWKQDTHFLQEEIDCRENHINKLENELRSLRAEISIKGGL